MAFGGPAEAARLHAFNDPERPEPDEAVCAGCGCTELQACPGGCWWVDSGSMLDLCSRCAGGHGGTD